jgi:hypothetical protein
MPFDRIPDIYSICDQMMPDQYRDVSLHIARHQAANLSPVVCSSSDVGLAGTPRVRLDKRLDKDGSSRRQMGLKTTQG